MLSLTALSLLPPARKSESESPWSGSHRTREIFSPTNVLVTGIVALCVSVSVSAAAAAQTVRYVCCCAKVVVCVL